MRSQNTPENKSSIFAGCGVSGAHFLLRGLLSESSFLSSEFSFLPPRLEAPRLFSEGSVWSLGFLLFCSDAAGLDFVHLVLLDRENRALMRRMEATVPNRLKVRTCPDRLFAWLWSMLRACDRGVSEPDWTGNFS